MYMHLIAECEVTFLDLITIWFTICVASLEMSKNHVKNKKFNTQVCEGYNKLCYLT